MYDKKEHTKLIKKEKNHEKQINNILNIPNNMGDVNRCF
jgi:hypothetical protein